MKTSKEYKVEYKVANCDYGTITVPKGTRLTHMTALGGDKNYHFVDEFDWYKPELKSYARVMAVHNFVHHGINVPKEYVEY